MTTATDDLLNVAHAITVKERDAARARTTQLEDMLGIIYAIVTDRIAMMLYCAGATSARTILLVCLRLFLGT